MNKTMKINDKKVYELERMMKEGLIPDEILDGSYVLYTTYFHQYAWGITGCNYASSVYVAEDGQTFPYAAAAYKAGKDNGIKPYTKKGTPSPYGEVGAEVFRREAITLRKFLTMKPYISSYKPNDVKTLKAVA